MRHQLIVTEAIARLAVARGARAEDEDFEVYIEAFDDLEATVVARACRALWNVERAEYESALPAVATIRKMAFQILREDEEKAARARLAPKRPALPMSEAEAAAHAAKGAARRDKFLADLRAMMHTKRMPS